LDIAIYRRVGKSRAAVVLIELEESKLTPKVLLGDIFSTLLGRSITSKRVPLRVGRWTTLIVAGLAGGTHVQRSKDLAQLAGTYLKTKRTGNAALGGIEVLDLSRSATPERALLTGIQPFIDKGLVILLAKE
jgi:hypothetical protein